LLTFGKRFDISHRSTTAKGHPLHKGYEHSTKHFGLSKVKAHWSKA